ncbi:hypothetical protein An15g03290 [Aspergillus niger]|uniref:Secreted protein n=2 Tax=Aspergillus niger TaxID=5061 RepID=A2R5A9_ASPNC|nr:hypothetical protein An15g03290 [Aspergillus niger]CAK42404.1 hypothetical protein An15g03290 [Aspergillus niger]
MRLWMNAIVALLFMGVAVAKEQILIMTLATTVIVKEMVAVTSRANITRATPLGLLFLAVVHDHDTQWPMLKDRRMSRKGRLYFAIVSP